MKTIIQFIVTEEQGVYTADGVNVPVVWKAVPLRSYRPIYGRP
jgi:hypothetical protein